jgi:hypothetical protein
MSRALDRRRQIQIEILPTLVLGGLATCVRTFLREPRRQ